MKRTEDKSAATPVADRRSFLKLAGASAVGVGATAVTGTAAVASVGETTPAAPTGYHESEHVKRYYQIARES